MRRTQRFSELLARLSVLLATLAIAGLLTPIDLASQQTGTVSGVVQARTTSQPIGTAQVVVTEHELGVLTDADGRFRIPDVPAGQVTVEVSIPGYERASRSVTVREGETATVQFSLVTRRIPLEEIVVTGTAGQRLRREQPAEIGEIDASELVETNPVTSVSNLLQSRSAGVSVSQSSGQSGTASRIRVRGMSSIALSNDPLIYIDGVRVSSGQQIARPDNPSQASPATSFDATGGAALSRLDDLDPEDIESVEIVKGPAAATLYGADASAGVIQIITKDGGAGGFHNQLKLEYTTIGKNFDPVANWSECTESAIDGGATLCQGASSGTLVSDNPLEREDIFQQGRAQRVSWSGRGGTEQYNFYVSASLADEEGTVEINENDSRRGRVNFNFDPHETLDVDVGYGVNWSETNLPMSNHSPLGIPTAGYAGQALAFTGEPGTGWFTGHGREGIFQVENRTRLTRNTASLTARHDPLDWLNHRLTLGGDFTRSERIQFFPRNDEVFYGGEMDAGLIDENRKSRESITVDYLGTLTKDLSEAWSADLSLGMQWIQQREEFVVATGIGLANNRAKSVGAAAEKTGDQYFQENRSLGFLSQLQLGFRDRLFVQLGARLDQNSSFGEDVPTFFLPKVGASWVISEESFFDAGWVDQLRLRAAFGTTGNSPEGGRDLRTYSPERYVDPLTGSVEPGVVLGNPGNPDLKAEQGQEIEAGIDASLLDQRLDVTLTYFNKVSKDLILQRPIAPSRGFQENPFDNIGEVVNRGVELSVGGQVVRGENLSWSLQASANTLSNELRDLGDLEPFGGDDGRFLVGYPLAAVFAHEILEIDTGAGHAVVTDTSVFMGPPVPDFEGSLQSTMNILGRFTVAAQADWRVGHIVNNSTADIRDNAFFNSRARWDSDFLPEEERIRRFGPFVTRDGADVSAGAVQTAYQEEGDFLRLRELAVSADLPTRWVSWLGPVQGARLRLAGRNLGLWTGYSGEDPEAIANTATNNFQAYSFFTMPIERRFIASLQLNF